MRSQRLIMRQMGPAAVNIVCDLSHPGGFGTHARCFASSLGQLLHVAVLDIGGRSRCEDLSPDLVELTRRSIVPTCPTIWIGPIMPVPELPGRPIIGWVTWETTEIPAPFLAALNRFDRVWVPSTFCKKILEAQLACKSVVDVVPEGVDVGIFRPPEEGREARPKPFQFLTVGKWERRKGHECAVRAFLRAFRKEDGVELGIRLTYSAKDRTQIAQELQRILERASSDNSSSIRLIPPSPIATVAEMYRNAHAFVLATRAEAWGLPVLEAMATGLPCIVTNYGGHLDFGTSENMFLVPHAGLVQAVDPVYFPPDHEWGLWAEPDIDRFAEIMRSVWTDYHAARRRGDRARQDACNLWTWAQSARVALQMLGHMDS